MKESVKNQLQYEKFRQQLEKGMTFPGEYPFKFIVKSDSDAARQIEAVFEGKEAKISSVPSSKCNYTSLTAVMKAGSPEDIIEIYKKTAEIPDVIKL